MRGFFVLDRQRGGEAAGTPTHPGGGEADSNHRLLAEEAEKKACSFAFFTSRGRNSP